MFKKKFKESMFESEVVVIISSKEEINKLWYDCNTDYKWFYAENWVLWIEEWDINLKYLSHEVLHFVAQQLRSVREIKMIAETEEMYCYFYSYYLDKIWKRITSLKIKK